MVPTQPKPTLNLIDRWYGLPTIDPATQAPTEAQTLTRWLLSGHGVHQLTVRLGPKGAQLAAREVAGRGGFADALWLAFGWRLKPLVSAPPCPSTVTHMVLQRPGGLIRMVNPVLTSTIALLHDLHGRGLSISVEVAIAWEPVELELMLACQKTLKTALRKRAPLAVVRRAERLWADAAGVGVCLRVRSSADLPPLVARRLADVLGSDLRCRLEPCVVGWPELATPAVLHGALGLMAGLGQQPDT